MMAIKTVTTPRHEYDIERNGKTTKFVLINVTHDEGDIENPDDYEICIESGNQLTNYWGTVQIQYNPRIGEEKMVAEFRKVLALVDVDDLA